jgi:hypothetical protein
MDWNHLWHFLSTAAKRKCQGLRFLFKSRPEEHIRDVVRSLGIPSVDLDCEGINKDIGTFISDTLARDDRFTRTSEEGKTLIRNSLVARANGMYVPHTFPLVRF